MLRGVEKRLVFIGTTDGALHKFESPPPADSAARGRSETPVSGRTGASNGQRGQLRFGKVTIGNRSHASRQIHSLGIIYLLLVPPENLLVSLGYDQVVKVLEMDSLSVMFTRKNPRCKYCGAAWNSLLRTLFLIDESGTVSAYNVFSGKILLEEPAVSPQQSPRGVSVIPGAGRLLLLDRGHATVWSVEQQVLVGQANYTGHDGPVISVVAVENDSREEHLIYTASEDNTIRCFDPYDNHCLRTYRETKGDDITCAIYNHQYKYIISGHDSGTLKIWNPDSGSFLKLGGHSNTVSCLVVGRDVKGDRRLISCDYDGAIGVYGLRKDRETRPHLINMLPDCHSGEILCSIFNPADDLVYTAGNDCVIKGWDERQVLNRERHWRPMSTFKGHTDAISCLAVDGLFLFSGSDDGRVIMWDTVSSSQLAVFDTSSMNAAGYIGGEGAAMTPGFRAAFVVPESEGISRHLLLQSYVDMCESVPDFIVLVAFDG
eukprot:SAG31_NODE_2307_length_5969_cov_21.904940_4_plen_488_part_00